MMMKCAGCGMEMHEADVMCSKCQSGMKCEGTECSCSCGNKVAVGDVKCKMCLEKSAA
ncbi:MAG: hypothetical protein V4674_01160 [Patescibacteria group bacterium]